MTDLEIDRALALAIGHKVAYVTVLGEGIPQVWVQVDPRFEWAIRVFSHNDWNVIGPIAARYNTFPIEDAFGRWLYWFCLTVTCRRFEILLSVLIPLMWSRSSSGNS